MFPLRLKLVLDFVLVFFFLHIANISSRSEIQTIFVCVTKKLNSFISFQFKKIKIDDS